MEQIDQITGKKNTMGIIEQLAQIKSEEAREEGLAQGQEISRRLFVENLLKNTEFSMEKIASLAGVPVELVHSVKNNL